eukprot:TRINITY_DN1227_c0_g1_i2.p1 TRINITY_DN1227_c0_g1~~TRINITY_DN1227_c0_g1_i2.p1  ORF type:complete len:190 (+),score=58.43 TRINITY_DN1227_c0_g1_i2:415-984(+)
MPQEVQDKAKALDTQIAELLKKVEGLGEEGKIEEAQAAMASIDVLKAEKEAMLAPSPQEKRMKVCEMCGAFLVIGDTEKRTLSHLEGKQHCGYQRIREALAQMKKERLERTAQPPLPPPRVSHRESRDLDVDRERDRHRSKSRERDREKDRVRERRSSRHSRSRSRSHSGERRRHHTGDESREHKRKRS